MPRLTNSLPKYRKHSSGNARVTINGRDYLLGPHGTKASKREYDRLIAEYLASGRSGSFGAKSDQLTMARVMADYLNYIGPKAQEILKTYLLRGGHDCLFRPCDSMKNRYERSRENRTTPLSCGNRPGTNRKSNPKRKAGDKYEVTAYARAITRAAKLAGVAHWSPNQLRHSRGTEVRKRFGLEAAQVMLGHQNADVTQIYAERDREKGIEIAREVG